jgi:hypothetical protein
MWEVGLPPLLCSFPPTATFQAFPLLIAGCVLQLLPSPAQLIYLQFCERLPSLPFGVQGAPPSLCLYCSYCFYSVSLFFPGWWSVVQGAMLIWPRVVCGGTVYHLAHLEVHVFPSHLGAGVWRWPGGPPGFSILHEVEMFCAG